MSSMRHESDLVLREDSLTRVTTGLVQLCKPAVKQTLGMSDEKVYDFSVSIERGRYQTVVKPGAPQLDLFTYGLCSGGRSHLHVSAELLAANTDEGTSCHRLRFFEWFVAFMSFHLLHSLIWFDDGDVPDHSPIPVLFCSYCAFPHSGLRIRTCLLV